MAATQPNNPIQNTGLIVIVIGIFMMVLAFLAATYLNSDLIRVNQDANSSTSSEERADLTQITCALWQSVGDPSDVDRSIIDTVREVCGPRP